MANTYCYPVMIWDTSQTPAVRKTGLTPTVVAVYKLSDGSSISTSDVTVSEAGNGLYRVLYDPVANGEAVCQIDFGSTLTVSQDRYVNVTLAVYTMIDMAQPTVAHGSVTSETVGQAMVAAIVDAFGKWVISGTTWNMYRQNGTDIEKAFTLDSSSAPLQRT
jgi:hypothetical protein